MSIGRIAAVVLVAGAAVAAAAYWRSQAAGDKPAASSAGVPVLVAVVEQRDVPHRVASIGTVQSLHTVVIRPQVSGVLTEVSFREGELVRQGASLARIDDRAIAAALAQAEAERASRAAQLRSAELDLARYSGVSGQQVVSRQQIEQQAAMVERLKADLQASDAIIAAQKVQLSFTRIVSPVSGRVGMRRVDAGNLVRATDVEGLVTVAQIDPISIVFTLTQDAMASVNLAPGKSALRVTAFDRDAGTMLAQGRVTTFDNQIDAASGTLRLRAEFANADGRLWPGQFVALQLETGMSPQALVFPARAMQQGLNGPFVFRIRAAKAEVVPVVPVYRDDDITAVATGLAAGDVVVIDGQSRLKAGSKVRLPAASGEAVMPEAEIPPLSTAEQRIARAGIADWFIRHPIGTTLLTVGLVLLGLIAFPLMPIAPVPEIDMPTIQIGARLPGASPETMASSVATPLEVQLSGISGIREMTSGSQLGSTSINVQFELDKDIDVAAQEVQAAINAAAGQMPADMPDPPTWKKGNPNSSPILALGMQSELMTLTELGDIADVLVARRFSQISGVSEVNVYGQRKPALRIQASPEKLASLGLTFADLRQMLRAASVNQAKGAIRGPDRVTTLATNDQIFTPGDYDKLVVAYRDGAPVFLRDVATVRQGAEDDYVVSWQNGKPGVYIMVRRQPGANMVQTADAVMAVLPEIRERLPASVSLEVLNNRTRTIRSSIHEVEITLGVTFMLVVLVMGVFLRQVSATAIVAVVLAVALIATVSAMYLLGFSLNNFTLVALIVGVGFIVDDAIVVVENIHRHLEAGASMREAALKGASEIGFTVVTISLSLVAAFIPLLMMRGVVGRLLFEFAASLTAAVLLSALLSLTLAPMLAARFMKALPHRENERPGLMTRVVARYERGLAWALDHQRTMLAVFGVTVVMAVGSYILVPKGFFPLQDTAYFVGSSRAADNVSYEEMLAKHQALYEILKDEPSFTAITHVVGATAPNPNLASGRFYIVLKDRSERSESTEEIIERLRPKLAAVPGMSLALRTQQDLDITSRGQRTNYMYVLTGGNSAELGEWAGRLTEALGELPGFRDVSNEMQLGASVRHIDIDRAAAARFGLSATDIDQVLYDAYGQRQVGQYQTELNQYRVILEADQRQRGRADSLQYFHLRSPLTGQMVPLSAVTRTGEPQAGPLSINHDGMFPSATIAFNLGPGVALGDAVKQVYDVQAHIGMPASIRGQFRGSAQAFQDSLDSQPLLILAALVAVYIILGVLYESFVHPLTILSTLPSAGVGAILSLWLMKFDFSIMALIGVVLLIGIVKKNGILMVDFALQRQRDGLSAREAVREACLVRFRPILMTTIAAMLGAVPLILAFGTGSEIRQPLGIAVFGGLLISQVLTLFTTPVIYLTLNRLFHGRTQPAGAAMGSALHIPK